MKETNVTIVISISVVIGSLLICLLLGILVRTLWDPIYCTISEKGNVIHSAELLQITPTVYVSEHVVTSGTRMWVQRKLRKFSRMVIVCDVTSAQGEAKKLCLINPCPLTNQLCLDLNSLGVVSVVIVVNCFHYLHLREYFDMYPSALFIIPSGLMLKHPEFSIFCTTFVTKKGTFFPRTSYFTLPDFYQEHVVYLEEAQLLIVGDTLIAQSANVSDPTYSSLSWLQNCIRSLSVKKENLPVLFCNYTLQFRLQSKDDNENIACWREILLLPISRVITIHGIYRGFVHVSQADLNALMIDLQQTPSVADKCGKFWFSFCVLNLCKCFFNDWVRLFPSTQSSNIIPLHIQSRQEDV